MSKKKLEVEIGVEAAIIGVVTSLNDYKLAWKINQVFKIELVLLEDLAIRVAKGNDIAVSNYCYQTDFVKINLIKNKGVDKLKVSYLVPELARIDYFIMLTGEDFFMEAPKVVELLRDVPEISFVQLIDTSKLKSKDNFIF